MIGQNATAGRPPTDLGLVARNRVWAHSAHRRGGGSWDYLDALFLPSDGRTDGARTRRFWYIGRTGQNPRPFDAMPRRILQVQVSELQPRANQVDLVARVDAHESFHGLSQEYYSWLWCLLAYPDIDSTEHMFLLSELMRQLGMFQCPAHLAAAGADELPEHPAFRPSTAPTLAIVSTLADATLNHVALLVCAFRLEFERLNLLAANDYLIAVRSALGCAMQRLGLPAPVARDLSRLVELRALRRDWETSEWDAADVPRRIRSRYKQQQAAFLDNLLGGEPRRDPLVSEPSYPIVMMTPTLQEFLVRSAVRRSAEFWSGASRSQAGRT